jgi:hypothetical protein
MGLSPKDNIEIDELNVKAKFLNYSLITRSYTDLLLGIARPPSLVHNIYL